MVFFKDKKNSPYSLEDPAMFLSERSLDRRAKNDIPLTEEDLPVSPAYVEALARMEGVSPAHATRWLNGLLVYMPEERCAAVLRLDCVRSVELVSTKNKRKPKKRKPGKRVEPEIDGSEHELPLTRIQNGLIGLDKMHQSGYRGENIYVAVLDEGFTAVSDLSAFRHLFEENRIRYTYDFVRNQTNVYHANRHGTMVLSALAGYKEGVYEGAAYKVDLALFITEEGGSEHPIEEYFWLFAAEKADFLGVDIINSSLGYFTFYDENKRLAERYSYRPEDLDGRHTVVARAATAAYARGILVLASAGNNARKEYPRVYTPADAPEAISVGSVGVTGVCSVFSARGPNQAQHLKPDIAALGERVIVFTHRGLERPSGTSLSAPLATGFVAGLMQYYPYKTHTQLRGILSRSAHLYDEPNYLLGYGLPDFSRAVDLEEVPDQAAAEKVEVFPHPLRADSASLGRLYVAIPRFEGVVTEVYVGNAHSTKALNAKVRRVGKGLFVVDFTRLPVGEYVLHVAYRTHGRRIARQAIKITYRA